MAKKRLSETVLGRLLGLQGNTSVPKTSTSSSGSSFKSAFAAARKAQGAGGTFTFEGNKYTTNYAEEAKAKKPVKSNSDPKGPRVSPKATQQQTALKQKKNLTDPKGPRVSPKIARAKQRAMDTATDKKAASQTAALKDLKAKLALEKMRATKKANSGSAAPNSGMYRPSEAKLEMYKRYGHANGVESQMAKFTRREWSKMTPTERLNKGLPTARSFIRSYPFKKSPPAGLTSLDDLGTTMGYAPLKVNLNYAYGGMSTKKNFGSTDYRHGGMVTKKMNK